MSDLHHQLDLPIIYLQKSGAERLQQCQNLVNSFQRFGFCLVSGAESVCSYEPQHALDLASWFFDLNLTNKMELATKAFEPRNQNVYRGYFPVQPGILSCKEGFEAGENTTLGSSDNPLLEQTPFPMIKGKERECAWFKEGYNQIRTALSNVADILMEMIAEAGGESSDFFEPMFHAGTPLSTHRIIRYPERKDGIPAQARLPDGRVISTGAHADSGFLTILETFGQPGLELEIDGEWRAVPPSPNLLIVNIGEQLARMSCGRWRATIHRVVDIGRDRISMPFFYEPYCDSNMNSTIPKSLLGSGALPEDDYVPFASFLLKKLVIYAEYSSLQSNLPDWMLQKYLKPEASNIQCWAEQTKQVVDGPQ